MKRKQNLVGQTFGRLTVLSLTREAGPFVREDGMLVYRGSQWKCRCSCGKVRETMDHYRLIYGTAKSCGCIAEEKGFESREGPKGTRKSVLPEYAFANGEGNFYTVWCGIKERCYSKNCRAFRNYGGRGIKVCPEWKSSYRTFALAVGPRPSLEHSIDRINTNGDYEPGNVRWATRKEQNNNMRTNRWLQWQGKAQTATQVAETENIPYTWFYNLISKGINVEEAVAVCKKRKEADYHPMPAFKKQDLTDRKFGYWTVLCENKEAHREKQKYSKAVIPSLWVCQCVCGKINKEVRVHALLSGKSCSCGCQRKHTLLRQQIAAARQTPSTPPVTHDDDFC